MMASVLVVGGLLGWVAHGARVQRDAVAAIERSGGHVSYDRDWRLAKSPWTRWIIDRLGPDHLGVVTKAELDPASDDPVMLQVGRLDRLEELHVFGAGVTAAGLAHLRGLDRLAILEVHAPRVEGPWLEPLRSMRRLRVLNLSGVQVLDDDPRHLAGLTGLDGLLIKSRHVTDAGLSHLGGLTRLEELQIADARITGAGLARLGDLDHLRILKLQQTTVEDLGPIRALPSLQELNLYRTPVGDDALAQLSGPGDLREINCKGTRVTDAGIAPIRQRFPQAHVSR